jgi:HAD superfamily hydrolase (TIGR01509 family)
MALLIFDCDGVLVDSEVLAGQTLAEMLAALGQPMSYEEVVRTFAGRSVKDVLDLIERRLGHAVPADIGQHYRERLFDRFRAALKPVPGVEHAIAALPYPRCVASFSSPERLHLALEVTGLAPLFGEHAFSATQVEHGKPAPDLFLFAARWMRVAAGECVVIEDSPLGVAAGRAADMTVVGFAGASHASDQLARRLQEAGAHAIIHAMRDLPACVQQLLGCGKMSR